MGTAVVESRIDMCVLATLDAYMCNVGQTPRSKSDLMWRVARLLHDSLVTNGLVEPVTDEMQAFTTLTERYGALGRGGRNGRTQMIDVQRATLQEDGFDSAYADNVKTKGAMTTDMRARYNEMRASLKKMGLPVHVTFEEFCENVKQTQVQMKDDAEQLVDVNAALALPLAPIAHAHVDAHVDADVGDDDAKPTR
jgi:hypothetical protein